MVIITMYRKIIQLRNQGFSREEIHRKTKVSPKTINKYLDMDDTIFLTYRNGHMFRPKVFDSFKAEILLVYEANDNEKLVMASVYDYLEEKNGRMPGNEGSLRNYIHYLVITKQLTFKTRHRIYSKVDELEYGKQMQLDFGEYKLPGGLKLYIFATILSGSRYKYAAFQEKPFTTKDVIMHLLDSFDYFGGRPEELVIDQDKTMVVSENRGDIIYTSTFKDFIEEMELKMYVCRRADPETKGKIENMVKFIKTSFLNCRNFETVAAANESLQDWLVRRANGKISQATRKVPALEIKKEQPMLRPVKNSIHRKELQLGREERTADDKARIFVQGSHYALPQSLRKQTVQIYITDRECHVFDNYNNEEIACYELSLIPGKLIKSRKLERESGKKLETLKDKALSLYDTSDWNMFLDKTFKEKSRYVRDQCIDAVKYFETIDDRRAFDEAITYCLENKTFSIAQLRDAWKYFKRSVEETPQLKLSLAITSRKQNMPVVENRSIEEYEDIIQEQVS